MQLWRAAHHADAHFLARLIKEVSTTENTCMQLAVLTRSFTVFHTCNLALLDSIEENMKLCEGYLYNLAPHYPLQKALCRSSRLHFRTPTEAICTIRNSLIVTFTHIRSSEVR